MRMPVIMFLIATLERRIERDGHEAAMTHAALRDQMLGKMLHLAALSLEHRDLHALIVIEMHMHGRQRQFAVIVEILRQSLGEFAHRVVIDIDDGGDAILLRIGFLGSLQDAGTRQIADRLRAVLIAART